VPQQRPKKSGHSIRDILGHTDDDDIKKAEDKPADLTTKKLPSISLPQKREKQTLDVITEPDVTSSQPKMTSQKRDTDDEDEDVQVDVDDEEQLWD